VRQLMEVIGGRMEILKDLPACTLNRLANNSKISKGDEGAIQELESIFENVHTLVERFDSKKSSVVAQEKLSSQEVDLF